jgi:hypothetical protein
VNLVGNEMKSWTKKVNVENMWIQIEIREPMACEANNGASTV